MRVTLTPRQDPVAGVGAEVAAQASSIRSVLYSSSPITAAARRAGGPPSASAARDQGARLVAG